MLRLMRLVILYADDDPADRELVCYLFSKGADLVDLRCVENGEQAINYLAGMGQFGDRDLFPSPDLVLLDLKMPRRSGFEVLEWARARTEYKKLPIIIMTSSAESPDVDRAYAAGANSYLVKTADLDQLAAALHSIVELAKLRRSRY